MATDGSALTPGDRIWLESVGTDGHEGATAAEIARLEEESRRREAAARLAVRQASCRHESTTDILVHGLSEPVSRVCDDCGAFLPPEDANP